ncbi:Candidapepsin-7 [Paramyrothecium foliicola]|nr:Candidapepsin-7 [Paramyrothecium foliicola]
MPSTSQCLLTPCGRLSTFSPSLLVVHARASGPTPISFEPGQWLGDDGNWSTVAVEVGSSLQKVNILVSTASSELWVIGPGGCLPNEPVCDAARGGVFTPAKSDSWRSLNSWELGLPYLGYGGNGDYGREMVSGRNAVTEDSFAISNIGVAAINTTDYYQGLFGLGIARGDFDDGEAVDSPLTSAGISAKSIPSLSYGYTAGAHYRNTPASLVLGGFDTSRQVSHNTKFTLSQEDNLPRPLVRGIEFVKTSNVASPDQPAKSTTEVLSNWDSAFLALVDSTTPYLWLPDWLCDRFAKALNLTYNDTFDLYAMTDEQYQTYKTPDLFNFTFSLSSLDNYNDLGTPLDIPGVVNITITSQAFLGLLQYPFKNAIQYGDPAIPYFSLRKSHDNSTFILGRAFLQEAYLTTRYDEATFSLHPAVFPGDSTSSAGVVAIEQSSNSPYAPQPRVQAPVPSGLRTREIVGISVGSALLVLAIVSGVWLFCRRRRRPNTEEEASVAKPPTTPSSSLSSTSQKTIGQLISRFIKRKHSAQSSSSSDEKGGAHVNVNEVPNSQIHELPAQTGPIELDGSNQEDDIVGEELGSSDEQRLGAYEAARQRMERQLQGPVPEYSPPAEGGLPPPEKAMHYPDEPAVSPVLAAPSATHFPPDDIADIPSPSTPSDVPRASWTRRLSGIPPPLTLPDNGPHPAEPFYPPSPSPCQPSDGFTLDPSIPLPSPLTPANFAFQAPSPAMHRTPITTSNILCLGPLPDNLQLSRHDSVSPAVSPVESSPVSGPDEQHLSAPSRGHVSRPSLDTLGSNYTETEERMAEATPETRAGLESSSDRVAIHHALLHLSMMPRQNSTHSTGPDSPNSGERVGCSTDFVHVPQMAAQRYSWEEDR